MGSLPATVLEFSHGGFHLGRELTEVKALCRDERGVSVILHCGRILAPLTSWAHQTLFDEPELDVAAAVRLLRDAAALSRPRAEQLLGLHQLVRDAQLARRQLHAADLDYAVLLLRKLLTWFFAELPGGPKLPREALAGEQVAPTTDSELALVVQCAEQPDAEFDAVFERHRAALLRSPVGPSLLAQSYISREGRVDSKTVQRVHDLVDAFPATGELHQFLANALSALGDSRAALSELELALCYDAQAPDVHRLLGDWHQQAWLSSARSNDVALHRALQSYQAAWALSSETDTQAGVEAAVLGVMRGRRERAESIAQVVIERYLQRWRAMGAAFKFRDVDDRLQLADAALILGEFDFARRRYNEALRTAPHQSVLTVKRRLKPFLPLCGIEDSATRFLAGDSPRRRRNSRQLVLPFAESSRE